MLWKGLRWRPYLIGLATVALGALLMMLVNRPSHGDDAARGRLLDRNGTPLAEDRDPGRYYPQGELAAHLVYGIDNASQRSLHGKNVVAPGDDLVLTIDLALQKVAHRAISGHAAAAAAVVEVNTGRILALASVPSFDPNAVTSDPAARERLKGDPRRPLLDRTLAQHYPPASTFKLIAAVAGLEHGAASPGEELTCTGQRTVGRRVLRDMSVHGTIDFLGALQHSCNVYFWTVGERVGLDRLAQVARDFGFAAPTGLGINGDVPGQVPVDAHYRGHSDDERAMRLLAVIGAGDVKATVLQVAMAYAALANGGRLYAPQVVRRVQDASGKTVEEREPILRRRIAASHETLATIRRGLWRAVNTRGGTGFAAKKGVVKMVGKTGTAELTGPEHAEEPHAWFAGWAPADDPSIVIVVLIENGGVGGAVAAPVARAIIDAHFKRAARKAERQAERRADRREAKREKAKRDKAEREKAEREKAERATARREKARREKARRQAKRPTARSRQATSAGARRRAKRRDPR